MQHFDYKPHGVCPMNISFDLDGDTVHNVSFKGGCNGNLQAISRVVEGMTVEQLLHLPSAAQVLKTEDPAMVAAYLTSVPDLPAEQTLPLMNLLNIRKEVSYVL